MQDNIPEHVDIRTTPLATELRAKFESLLPGVIDDGVLDVSRLSEILGVRTAGTSEEREGFGLRWAGRGEAVNALRIFSLAALSPDLSSSIDFDEGQNIFIEGENLEVLKLLQKGYNDRIRLIYIDPPYNTGKDFVYRDDFSDPKLRYLEVSGQVDAQGNRLLANTEVTGRKHSNWLSMMYPRLVLARNLLTEDGAIFVSIDDNEVSHLRLLLDEVFGPENFIANLIWKSKSGGANDSKYFAVDHEYILCYARNSEKFGLNLDKSAAVTTSYPFVDENGRYGLERLDKQNLRYNKSLDYVLVGPDGVEYRLAHKNPKQPNATWRWSKDRVQENLADLVFRDGHVYTKNYQKEGAIPRSLLLDERFGRTRTGSSELRELLGGSFFDNPKPTKLISFLVSLATGPDDIVLDFFGGSGTTAHAVALLNDEEASRRRFIMVTANEDTHESSNAREAGFETVSQICLARILKVVEQSDSARNQGLKVFKLSSSAFAKVSESDNELPLQLFENTLRPEANDNEIAAEVLLKHGVSLDQKWVRSKYESADVVKSGGVAVVLARQASTAVTDAALADSSVQTVIFLEDSFAGIDDVKANAYFGFKHANKTMKTM